MTSNGSRPWRIVHVVRSNSFAGVERYVCRVANELSARGHSLQVVGGDPARMRAELDETIPRFPAVSTGETFLALRKLGRVDLVHAHMTAAEVASICARVSHRAPVVSTRHFPDPRARDLPRWVGGTVRSQLAEQISISRFVAEGIAERSVLVQNGVPDRAPALLEAPHALTMQRLDPEKAPGVGLEAWASSGLAERGWRLSVAGSGRLTSFLRSLATRLGVEDSVSFLGRVADTDELLARSSIFLAPAPAEPFGLAVAEAMAHGVPVVAAAGGAHLETLGEEGLFFPPGDFEQGASWLAALAADAAKRRMVGTALQARQRRLFSLGAHVERLEQVYGALLAGRGAGPRA